MARSSSDEYHGMTLESRSGKMILRGALDQSQLHGVLGRIQAYSLELIEVGTEVGKWSALTETKE